MTKEKFIEIIKNDPRFKLSGKSAVVSLWVSPFSSVTTDIETGDTTFLLDGESITLTADEIQELYPILDTIGAAEAAHVITTKAVIYRIGFNEHGAPNLFDATGTPNLDLSNAIGYWDEGGFS